MSLEEERDVEKRLTKAVDMSTKQHNKKLLFSLKEKLESVSQRENLVAQQQLHAVYVASKLSNGRMVEWSNGFHYFRHGFVPYWVRSANR